MAIGLKTRGTILASLAAAMFAQGNQFSPGRKSKSITPVIYEPSLKEKKELFKKLLTENNTKASDNKHWYLFKIEGVDIFAYNEKNARKTLNYALKHSNLTLEELI